MKRLLCLAVLLWGAAAVAEPLGKPADAAPKWRVTASADSRAVNLTPSLPASTKWKCIVSPVGTTPVNVILLWVESGEPFYAVFYPSMSAAPGPGPNPNPDPDPPPPPPPPPPVPAELWGIVVEESAERTPQQAIVIASPVVRALFDKGEFRVVDDDMEVESAIKPYIERAKGKLLPQFYVVDAKGTIFYEGPLPATVADMQKLVAGLKAKGGGK